MTDHSKAAQTPIATREDYDWWADLAPQLQWSFATTMPQWPHEYVVRGEQLSYADANRAGRVLWAFGRPASFYTKPQRYLDMPDGYRYWTAGCQPADDTDLINRSNVEDTWAKLNAPFVDLSPEADSRYDSVATVYDEMYQDENDEAENTTIRSRIAQYFGARGISVLDVGCGTGLLLDMSVCPASLYTGIDPSRAMISETFAKHPHAHKLIHGTAAHALPPLAAMGLQYDLTAALFGSASYMEPDDLDTMVHMTKPGGLFMAMTYKRGYVPAYYTDQAERARVAEHADTITEWFETDAFKGHSQLSRETLGKFDVWTVAL